MTDKHLSSQFDADLARLSTRLLAMGGMVEQQVTRAVVLLERFVPREFAAIVEDEKHVNLAERELDEALGQVIARRQPAARDLRLLMASSKCTSNLERAADEAHKVAKCAKRIDEQVEPQAFDFAEVLRAGQLASDILNRALDAFARMDTKAAIQVMEDDFAIDEEFRAFATRMVPYMSEHPRMISVALDYMFVAKGIERIGDHATNIAEFVVYVVGGTDIRHATANVLNRCARYG
ncbi:phosphate uptake regulator PhoU [Caballeronia arvi]|uniref:Phosphate-specific transport system accessory protein PhoU n=1 Tax=Caballeronia arvi TaxID=1777135 RepID=A0A158L124_9BURK|nr:phosphate signaling complex protein PhoU [Caballeronia arvi]SAL86935.1 phosphate uptake regulator PhoU [Caballeronia arvi]